MGTFCSDSPCPSLPPFCAAHRTSSLLLSPPIVTVAWRRNTKVPGAKSIPFSVCRIQKDVDPTCGERREHHVVSILRQVHQLCNMPAFSVDIHSRCKV